MDAILRATRLKAELDSLRPIDKDQEARIMQKFRLDWNYHSNHLEGNSLSYGETKALLLFGITAQGKPLKDHFEITGHNEAINWVLDVVGGDRPLTENFIRELHTLLLREPYQKVAKTADGQKTTRNISVGQYKTTPNHVETVTGEIFRFATPEETPALMHELMQWYLAKDERPDLEPILLAAEFHYKFIRIHPFDDGNGRTARILMNFILMKHGYPPVIIRTEDKQNYFAALRQADAGMIEPFIEYIAQNLNRSLDIMIAGAKGESIEEEGDLDKEIALLEQELKQLSRPLIVPKSENSIVEVVQKNGIRIQNGFHEIANKFKKFFFSVEYHINYRGTGTDKHFQDIGDFLEESPGQPYQMNFELTFRGLKFEGQSNFYLNISCRLKFNDYEYLLESDHKNSPLVILGYDSEIRDLVLKEMFDHFKRFIVGSINERIESLKKSRKS